MGVLNITGITGGSPNYEIELYEVGVTLPVNTYITTTNELLNQTFTHTNGKSYYTKVKKTGCNDFISSDSILNCCNIITTNPIYKCNQNSTTFKVEFNITGGTNNYIFQINNNGNWSSTNSLFSEVFLNGSYIITIANSDFSCPINLTINNTDSCSLCAEILVNNLIVACEPSISDANTRVTFDFGILSILGCNYTGNFEYSDDNGITWNVVLNSFNKVYNTQFSHVILLRHTSLIGYVKTINIPDLDINCEVFGDELNRSSCKCEDIARKCGCDAKILLLEIPNDIIATGIIVDTIPNSASPLCYCSIPCSCSWATFAESKPTLPFIITYYSERAYSILFSRYNYCTGTPVLVDTYYVPSAIYNWVFIANLKPYEKITYEIQAVPSSPCPYNKCHVQLDNYCASSRWGEPVNNQETIIYDVFKGDLETEPNISETITMFYSDLITIF